MHALAILAPASALVVGLEDPARALALLGVAGAALAAARMPGVDRLALQAIAAVARALPRLGRARRPCSSPIPPLRQQGQALLSGMWALVGVAALVAGLLRDRRELRLGALALLAVTLGKVCLYDLSSLDSMYRVASFIGLGLLLLVGAFAWQRLAAPAYPVQVTPDHDPDLRRAESLDEELLEAETVDVETYLTDAPRLERIHEELRERLRGARARRQGGLDLRLRPHAAATTREYEHARAARAASSARRASRSSPAAAPGSWRRPTAARSEAGVRLDRPRHRAPARAVRMNRLRRPRR